MRPWILKYFLILLLCAPARQGMAQVRSVPDSVTEQMKSADDFRYANDPSFWQKQKTTDNSRLVAFISMLTRSTFLKWLLYLIVAAGVIYVIYQVIAVNNFFVFSRSGRRRRNAADGAEAGEAENISEKLHDAIAAGQYRMAIRYYYLLTLKSLSEKDFISLNSRSTNYDYVRQLQSHPNIKDFRMLTGIYEYVWYGEFYPNASQFESLSSDFKKFNDRI